MCSALTGILTPIPWSSTP